MFTNDEWEFFLTSWKEQYGQEKRGRTGTPYMVVPGNSVLRREMYRTLIASLIERGFTKSDLTSTSTKDRVIRVSTSENLGGNSLRQWKEGCGRDWLTELALQFPVEFTQGSTETIRKSEQVENPRFVDEAPQEQSYSAIESDIVLENPIDRARLKTGIPVPNYEVDEEFMRLLIGDGNER